MFNCLETSSMTQTILYRLGINDLFISGYGKMGIKGQNKTQGLRPDCITPISFIFSCSKYTVFAGCVCVCGGVGVGVGGKGGWGCVFGVYVKSYSYLTNESYLTTFAYFYANIKLYHICKYWRWQIGRGNN